LVKKVYRKSKMEEGMLDRSTSTSAVECIAITSNSNGKSIRL